MKGSQITNTSPQITWHHRHATAKASFKPKKKFGHRNGRSSCAHSIGKFFLCYMVLFSFETSATGSPGNYLYVETFSGCSFGWLGPRSVHNCYAMQRQEERGGFHLPPFRVLLSLWPQAWRKRAIYMSHVNPKQFQSTNKTGVYVKRLNYTQTSRKEQGDYHLPMLVPPNVPRLPHAEQTMKPRKGRVKEIDTTETNKKQWQKKRGCTWLHDTETLWFWAYPVLMAIGLVGCLVSKSFGNLSDTRWCLFPLWS